MIMVWKLYKRLKTCYFTKQNVYQYVYLINIWFKSPKKNNWKMGQTLKKVKLCKNMHYKLSLF